MRVNASGELQLTGNMGGVEYKNGRITISGEQVYDPAVREWTSGDLDIVISYDLEVNGRIASFAAGNMKATLRRLASSPTKPLTVNRDVRK